MSNVKEMIVVEDRLTEMFDMLPAITSLDGKFEYLPTFGYGDPKELNAFLKHAIKTKSPYPLIWLLYPYTEEHSKTKVSIDKLTLILAVKTDAVAQNKERLEDSYKKLLIPLYNNIVTLFKRACIVNSDEHYTVIKYPNYSYSEAREKHAGTFIWDALKVTLSMSITDDCLRPIRF